MQKIQEEVALIDPIIIAENGSNPLPGYPIQHVRQQTAGLGANNPFDAFCASIQATKKGNVRIARNDFVENGFAVQSDNYEYYGTLVNNRITHLSLTAWDSVDDEFSQLVSTRDLVRVNEARCSITKL